MDSDTQQEQQEQEQEGPITLLIKRSSKNQFELEVSNTSVLVSSLKQMLSERTSIVIERIRLMLESTILSDERSLESYGITNSSVLRLVQLAQNPQSQLRNANGINNASEAAQRPSAMQSLTSSTRDLLFSNPQFAQTLMMANPQMREALENNPELRALMNDPQTMRQSLDAAQNPQLMNEVQRNNDRALSNLEALPGGYDHIRRMYHSIHEPLARAAENSTRYPLDELNRRRARMMGVTKPDSSKINTTPLPNPWARNAGGRARAGSRSSAASSRGGPMFDQVSRNADRLARLDLSSSLARRQALVSDDSFRASIQDLQRQINTLPSMVSSQQPLRTELPQQRLPNARSSANQQQTSSSSNPTQNDSTFRELYKDELDQLEEMGFPDKDKNLRALISTNGDLSQALSVIAGEDD